MQRRWAVHPDMQIETSEGTIPFVSREALIDAVLDGVAHLDRSGGVLTVMVGRHRTDLEGEAVTTSAVVGWNAGPRAPARPEANVKLAGVESSPEPVEPETVEPEAEVEEALVGAIPDGLDESTLDDEDLSSIPENMRA